MNMLKALLDSDTSVSFKVELYDVMVCRIEWFRSKRGRRAARSHSAQVWVIEAFTYYEEVDKIDWDDDVRKGREPREEYWHGKWAIKKGILTLI